jgi:hypothetical protein
LALSLTKVSTSFATSPLLKGLLLCQHVNLDSFAKSTCFKGFHFFFLWHFLCETPSLSSTSLVDPLGPFSLLECELEVEHEASGSSTLVFPLVLCEAFSNYLNLT